jgi:hypothetical protein
MEGVAMDAPTASIIVGILSAAAAITAALISSRATLKAAQLKAASADEAKPVSTSRQPKTDTRAQRPTAERMARSYVIVRQGSNGPWSNGLLLWCWIGPVGVAGLYYILSNKFPEDWTAAIWTGVGGFIFVLGLIIFSLLERIEMEKRTLRPERRNSENPK